MNTTTFATKKTAKNDWYVLDAAEKAVGRLATRIAMVLMGKHKPIYTPHIDTGDFVVVVNCEKAILTGAKMDRKVYRHHTGYQGGLVEEGARRLFERRPDRVLFKAVRRMLPKTKMGDAMIRKLKLYVGAEHPHAAQQPKEMKIETRRK